MRRKLYLIGSFLFLSIVGFTQATKNFSQQKEGFTMTQSKISIAFPLRGEWFTETSPADRVPSHGTNHFGLRYAFDFIQKDRKGASHTGGAADYIFKGIPLDNYYCFVNRCLPHLTEK